MRAPAGLWNSSILRQKPCRRHFRGTLPHRRGLIVIAAVGVEVRPMFGPPDWRKYTTDRSGIMRKFWSAVLVLAVAGIIGAGSAFAADPPKKERKKGERPSLEQIFKKLDTTADNNLTAEELAESPRLKGDKDKAAAIIAKMKDKDGKVTCEAFCNHIKKMHAEHHKKGDAKKGDAKRHEHKKGGAKKGDHHKKGGHKDGAKKRGDKKPECKK